MKKEVLIIASAFLIFLMYVIYKIAIFVIEHKFFVISGLILAITTIFLIVWNSESSKRKRRIEKLRQRKKKLHEKYGIFEEKETKEKDLKQEEAKTTDIYKYEQKWANEKREQKQQSKIQKGKAYEFFIGNYFKQRGYKIYYQGVNQGLKDYGIDLIAYKGNETMLIQCKNWEKWKINKKVLDKFNNDCDRYIGYHQRQTRYKSVKRVFVVANTNLTQDAKNQLFNPSNNIEFLHIPFN